MKKFIIKKKIIFFSSLFVTLFILLLFFVFKPSLQTQVFSWINNIKDQVVSKDYYNDGIIDDSNLSREAIVRLYDSYLAEGLKYKASGDAGNKDDYVSAVKSFQKAIDLTEGKFWVPVVNVANLYKAMGDYAQSDKYYDQALKISNYSEQSIYLAKIELYRYYLKSDEEKVISIYKESLDNVVIDRNNLLVSYAGFLRDSGRYEDAIKQYEYLSQLYPDNGAYKDAINTLKLR